MSRQEAADSNLPSAGIGVNPVIRAHVEYQPRGDGWTGMPELPLPEEILQSNEEVEDLPRNTVDQRWPSKAAYLNAQYKILRREGTEGLRYSVNSYKGDSTMGDDKATCIYTKVFVTGYLMARIGAVCRVKFSTERAGVRVKWQQSRRLTQGTIVAITTVKDGFQSICKIATVAQRPFIGGLDQTPPLIDIIWARPDDAVLDPNEELVMVESRCGYYEAVRYPLVGLQHVAKNPSPLDKYIVSCNHDIGAPRYVHEDPVMDISSLVHHAPVNSGPKEAYELLKAQEPFVAHDMLYGIPDEIKLETSMNGSQIEALHRMVSKELAIIQGPPGTGKTFTSVSALDVLRVNRRPGDPPIIVAAQTNHALDQILDICMKRDARILRVGGRTDSETIRERTIYNLRRHSASSKGRGRYRTLDTRRNQHINTFEEAVSSTFPEGVLNPKDLLSLNILSDAQFASLAGADWDYRAGHDDTSDLEDAEAHKDLEMWLGEQLIPSANIRDEVPSFELEEPDNDEVGYEYEVDLGLDRAADEEDDDRLSGTWIPISWTLTGKASSVKARKSKSDPAALLASAQDLWDIPAAMRGAVYRHLQAEALKAACPGMLECLRGYKQCCKDLTLHKWTRDTELLRSEEIEIVGCTTTGLTKYRGFLAALEPRTVLVEEAAETREANIVSAIYSSLQQLILVGDHQQLTPHCDVQLLGGHPFYLNVSLFERMVRMKIPYTTLTQQRRMKPELRKILNYFYPAMCDHPQVEDMALRPDVPGMGGRNTWLFHHAWPEEVDGDSSKFNTREAEMIAKFVAYLVSNGISLSQITVLTFYNGQRKLLLRKLRGEVAMQAAMQGAGSLNVFTVDSYQGEENDIVLLSLVRSPKAGQPNRVGFLEDRNRATVAISRARCGFYIFGNLTNLLHASKESSDVWGRVQYAFAQSGHIDARRGLPTVCQKHQKECWFTEPDGFIGNAGGCWKKCGGKLPCGHDCKLACHPRPHESYQCHEPCVRMLLCGHSCSRKCVEKCHCVTCHFQMTAARLRSVQRERAYHPPLQDVLDGVDLGADEKIPEVAQEIIEAVARATAPGLVRGAQVDSRGSRGRGNARGYPRGGVHPGRANSVQPQPSGRGLPLCGGQFPQLPRGALQGRGRGQGTGSQTRRKYIAGVEAHDDQASRQAARDAATTVASASWSAAGDPPLIDFDGVGDNSNGRTTDATTTRSSGQKGTTIQQLFKKVQIIDGRRTSQQPAVMDLGSAPSVQRHGSSTGAVASASELSPARVAEMDRPGWGQGRGFVGDARGLSRGADAAPGPHVGVSVGVGVSALAASPGAQSHRGGRQSGQRQREPSDEDWL